MRDDFITPPARFLDVASGWNLVVILNGQLRGIAAAVHGADRDDVCF